MRIAPVVLIGSVAVAAALAIFRPEGTAPASAGTSVPPLQDPIAMPTPEGAELPPNHPPIGGGALGGGALGGGAGGSAAGTIGPSTDDPVAMTWKVPGAWKVAPNPNTMRLATYRVPGAPGADDAEVSVSRAGGTLDANIQRWVGQFEGAGKEARTERTVHGLAVTLVEIHGAYLGGGMGNAAPAQRPGWAMLAAIVQTSGIPYFVKMVGPDATVKASRASFDELVASATPAQ